MMRLLFLSISLTALISACAPGSAPKSGVSEPVDADTKTDVTADVPISQAAQVSATLFCSSNCPPALGMFIERLDDGAISHFNRCTSFLVAPDIVATASHCLSKDLRSPGALKAGRVSIVFGSGETIAVTDVLSATPVDPTNLSPDLAFLKLDHPAQNRKPLSLSRAGLSDRETLTAFVIDPVGDRFHLDGRVREIPCLATQNTLIAPSFTSDFSTVASARCALRKGHSGSPLVARDGQVRAVAHAVLPQDRSISRYRGFKMPQKLSPAVLATNLACTVLPNQNEPLPGACAKPVPSNKDLIRELANRRAFDFDGAFQKWKQPLTFRFQKYELGDATDALSKSAIPRAECVRPSTKWVRKPARAIGAEKLEFVKHDVVVTLSLPLWGLVAELDQDERVTPVLGERDRVHVIYQFDLESFEKSGRARVTQTMVSENGLVSSNASVYDLPICAGDKTAP